MKLLNETLNWYEANLPSNERKRRGHFSTPPSLVEQILDACGYTSHADLAQVRVLDPACGGGNFLAGAARRLVAFATRRGLDQEAQIALVQRNLWGLDPDPVACFLTEMQLRTTLQQAWQEVGHKSWDWERQGEPPCDTQVYSEMGQPTQEVLYNSELQIHQADGLALPWIPCIDLFVANPPYLAAKNTDLSGYQLAQQRGQADSYLLFLNCALQVVRPGGWMGLVLPDPLLVRANAVSERARLLRDATIYHIWHLSGVFTAEVGAVVIIAQKCPPSPVHRISWERGKWQRGLGAQLTVPSAYQTNTVPQSLFLKQPRAELRYLLSGEHGTIAERLRSYLEEIHPPSSRLAPLSNFLSISRGEELAKDSSYITPIIQARSTTSSSSSPIYRGTDPCDIVSSRDWSLPGEQVCSAYCPQYPAYPTWHPVLRGGVDIRPYGTPIANRCIAREAIVKPLERYLSPKLLVVKSTDRLQATLDTQGHIVLQTLYLLHLRNVGATARVAPDGLAEPSLGDRYAPDDPHLLTGALDDLYFFLALLNSRLLREYVYILHTAYKWVQPQIEQSVLAQLLIPIVEAEERQQIIELSKRLMSACSMEASVVEWKQLTHSMYEEQEHAVRRLYASALPGLFASTS
jgi:SAM-dependent methyltransferase